MLEVWRSVVGWKGIYEVSSLGRVRNVLACNRSAAGRLLKPRLNHKGYPCVALQRRGRVRNCAVHTLVAEAFIGPKPAGLQVDHGDGVKTNNRCKNLEYVTCAENIRRAVARGLRPVFQGSRTSQAKIVEKDVRRIRALCARGRTQREVGGLFGLTQANVSEIVRRKTWNHVK